MEADEYEHDSTFGGDRESIASSSTSITSAVTRFRHENGRRYHGYEDGKYLFPDDEKELDRQDIEHHTCKLQLDGKLYLAPLTDDPKEILDLGTGTGIWCIDMADQFPDCQIIGTDLSPIQPSWVPANCRFEIDDFDKEWTFGDNRFDMIHHRYLVAHISDYPNFYKRALAALKPGGCIELVEIEWQIHCDDGSVPEDAAILQWGRLMNEAFAKMDRFAPNAGHYEGWLRDAGFDDVTVHPIKRPSNDWPKDPRMKEIGRYCCLNFLEGMEAFTVAPFTRLLGWSVVEVQILLAKMRKEWCTRKYHAYHKAMVIYGTKPMHPSN